jgi:hypothetical protein
METYIEHCQLETDYTLTAEADGLKLLTVHPPFGESR